IGVSVVFVGIGLYDDVRRLSPTAKLLLQSLGACLVIHFGVVYHFRLSFWINAAVTLLWIVGITNALNLLDNIDGLSVGVAAISVGRRDHTSHRLAAVGLNDRRVVLVFYFLSACSGMLAVLLHQFPSAGVSVIPLFLILITLLGIYLVSSRNAWPAPSQRGPLLVLAQSFFPLLIDLVLLTVAYYSAFLLRFQGTLIHANTILFWRTLPLVIGSHVIVTSLSGIYWDRPVVLSLYHVFRI